MVIAYTPFAPELSVISALIVRADTESGGLDARTDSELSLEIRRPMYVGEVAFFVCATEHLSAPSSFRNVRAHYSDAPSFLNSRPIPDLASAWLAFS